MVNPRHEPGFEQERDYPEHPKTKKGMRRHLRTRWKERMRSRLIRMSRGAQNFWTSLPWPHKENWRRQNKKK